MRVFGDTQREVCIFTLTPAYTRWTLETAREALNMAIGVVSADPGFSDITATLDKEITGDWRIYLKVGVQVATMKQFNDVKRCMTDGLTALMFKEEAP